MTSIKKFFFFGIYLQKFNNLHQYFNAKQEHEYGFFFCCDDLNTGLYSLHKPILYAYSIKKEYF